MTVRAAVVHMHNMPHYSGESHRSVRRAGQAPYPTIASMNALSNASGGMQVMSSPSSNAASEQQRPQRIYRISTRRIKRVPVTSCDSCRLRKLKCNAKDLPHGASCSQCKKHNASCTFEDRDEVANVPLRKIAATARSSVPPARTGAKQLHPQNNGTLENGMSTGAQLAAGRQRSSNVIQLPPLAPSNTARQVASAGVHDLGAYSLGPATQITVAQDTTKMESTLTSTWRQLGMPSYYTNPSDNKVQTTNVVSLLHILTNRFLEDDRSFVNLVIANRATVDERMRQMEGSSSVDYFILTIVACAVLSDKTNEPELVQWRQEIWRHASKAVQEQMDYEQTSASSSNNLEIVQALLLLSVCWPGELARVERINTFDAAVSIATSFNLHSSSYLTCGVGSASERVALFWLLYSYDKILTSASKRPISIPRISHDISMLSKRDFAQLGIRLTSYEEICLQRLFNSFVSLCQILEGLQDCQHGTQLQYVMQSSHMLINKLEQFCLDNEWYMNTKAQTLPVVCRSLAQAITSQMHLTRLQLYALHVRVDLFSKPYRPAELSSECHSSMAAAISSAWHLIQIGGQTTNVTTIAVDSMASSRFAATTFSSVCFTFGSDFFRFLAANWSQWNGGRGCLAYCQSFPVCPVDEVVASQASASPALSYASTSALRATGMADTTNGLPHLDLETMSSTGNSTYVESVRDDEEPCCGQDLLLPDKSSTIPQCDTATLFSMILNSPAVQFFSQSQPRSDVNSPPRSAVAVSPTKNTGEGGLTNTAKSVQANERPLAMRQSAVAV